MVAFVILEISPDQALPQTHGSKHAINAACNPWDRCELIGTLFSVSASFVGGIEEIPPSDVEESRSRMVINFQSALQDKRLVAYS
jgi:hypothetical protein